MAPTAVQWAVLVALLGVVPIAVFIVTGQAELLGTLAGVNVVIITASLYWLYGPAEQRHGRPA